MSAKKFIDVEKILKEKATKLHKILPGFAINWLKRKLHEDDINSGMEYLSRFHGLKFNEEVLKYFNIHLEVSGIENLPASGGVIIAGNHPLGGLDGMALIKVIGDVRPDVRFIVNDILKNLKNFGDIFVGVNKVGGQSRGSLQEVEQVYASDAAILVFPAGLVSRKLSEGIRDLDWNKSFITKAIKNKKPILPVYIEGKNSAFFYNFARWRKRFGVKANIEMLFLPDEMFRQKGNTIRVYFGKIVDPEFFSSDGSAQNWAKKMRDYIYSGAVQKNISFNDYLKGK